MARKIEYTSIIQLDAQSISLLRFKSLGKSIENPVYLRVSGDYNDPETQALAVKAFAEEQDLCQDRVYLVLPRYEITTRTLTLPSHDAREIAGMVRFSAEEFVPYTIEEVVIDQCILRELDNGESHVLVALAHRDVVERHLSLLRQAGVTPEQMLLSTACIASAALASYPDISARYALVSLGADGIEITVINGGVVVFTRGIPTVQDWASIAADPDASAGVGVLDAGGAEELASEIRGSLAAYRRESADGTGVDHIYVACAFADMKLLCQHLSEQLGRECMPASFALSILGGEAASLPGIPLEAIGGALESQRRAKVRLHLLPKQETEARRLAHLQRLTVRAAIIAATLLALFGVYYYQALSHRSRMIEELEQRIAAIEPGARGITEKREQLNILRRQVDRTGSIVEQLAHLVEAAPEGRLNFTRLSLRRNDGINLWGRAKTVNDVARYAENIRSKADRHLRFFARARSLYEHQTQERNEPVFTYQIEVSALEDEDDR